MLDDDTVAQAPSQQQAPAAASDQTQTDPAPRRTRRRAASRPAGPPQPAEEETTAAGGGSTGVTAKKTAAKKTAAKKTAAKKTAAKKTAAKKATAKKTAAKKTAAKKVATPAPDDQATDDEATDSQAAAVPDETTPRTRRTRKRTAAADTPSQGSDGAANEAASAAFTPVFQAPAAAEAAPTASADQAVDAQPDSQAADTSSDSGHSAGEEGGTRRRRSRGGRNRRRSGGDDAKQPSDKDAKQPSDKDGKIDKDGKESEQGTGGSAKSSGQDSKKSGGKSEEPVDTDESGGSSRRRRRRKRGGQDGGNQPAESGDKSARSSEPRAKKQSATAVEGSTRIEAKRQRRREGRAAGRRRPPILSESEFRARRESVERVMAIRQRGETTQIGVLEDNVLVEHYVALESQSSIIGNVYLGRVQNVLPSMEAAFIDIGKGRNAVLYAGEVNWSLKTDKNAPRRIENALKPGQSVLVQVSKDPIGHKGARLTSQISLPGRYLVFVPGGETSGISRKLPDTERNRLKTLLKDILPDEAGVIIRTAAEGASEAELTRDVTRLTARWEDIDTKSKKGKAPQLLYAEPDTTLKVVRDLFTEDFTKLVISGDDAWDMVDGYIQHVAPDLTDRIERADGDDDVFSTFRVDEQIAKAMERKVWLPSGGSLVIDRTEAMTVVDVNTGKFTGSGGNLEETVTKNNLEAAEEIVRQLRLRDIGGIIVVDFIDMVLESNRDLVLRRLVECLGRDRTRHQVAEVTSLGLVQMTRKRISTGLIEAFSHPCEQCHGRGVIVESEPAEPQSSESSSGNGKGGGKRGGKGGSSGTSTGSGGRRKEAKSSGDDSTSDDQQSADGSGERNEERTQLVTT
ncbi:MAG: Rne/Rng family ribonuclease [Nocardioidaceae bacterium]